MKVKKKNAKRIQIGLLLIVLTLVASLLSGCGTKTLVDTTFRYNYAWILMPNGNVVEGEVQTWTDFQNGDQIQVKINGVTYLTDTTRCVLANGYKK